MKGGLTAAFATAAALAGCVHPARRPPTPTAHYIVPAPWKGARNVWFYPSARFGGSWSGLASPMDVASAGDRTADGAPFDPRVPGAAVQSLQLPVVLRVTNLLNGREMLLRADDKGPDDPGRVVALDASARRLLGIAGATPVRVAIDTALSQALADQFGALPKADTTAPIGAVTETPLGPPGAAGPALPVAATRNTPASEVPPAPVSVPDTVSTVPVGAVTLMLDGGTFSGEAAARSVSAAIGGRAVPDGSGRHREWHVIRGPFVSVEEADHALDQAEAAGISGARIVAQDLFESDAP